MAEFVEGERKDQREGDQDKCQVLVLEDQLDHRVVGFSRERLNLTEIGPRHSDFAARSAPTSQLPWIVSDLHSFWSYPEASGRIINGAE